jgi:transcriptional regulator with XRE-family HTH domain
MANKYNFRYNVIWEGYNMNDIIQELYLQMGAQIQYYRKNKKLSAEELGKRISVTKKTIRRYELGEIRLSYERAKQIAEALDLDVRQLYNNEKKPHPLELLAELDLTYRGKILSKEKKLQLVDVMTKILDLTP